MPDIITVIEINQNVTFQIILSPRLYQSNTAFLFDGIFIQSFYFQIINLLLINVECVVIYYLR